MPYELMNRAFVDMWWPYALGINLAEFVPVIPISIRPKLVEAIQLSNVAGEEAAWRQFQPLGSMFRELLHDRPNLP